MAKSTDQAFESIRIVGGLISSKVLQDARRYDLPGQSKENYQIEPGLTFNDDIGRYWRIAQARWQEFQLQCQRQDISSHIIAQREWLIPLLEKVLGYRLESSKPVMLGEREFPITHSAFNRTVPFVLCGAEYDLDKGDAIFGQEGRKRSPMGLLQEYLNAESTALWAIVSNGLVLRLLRDNPAMTRPAYIEVDFARMFEEDNYADFATLWLTLHATRLEPQNNHPEQCWLEQWRGKGQDEGERALDKLRYGVADALRQLGTGFVAHKNNQALRDKLSNGELTTDAYFQQVLRLVYRFLFLLTSEDRNVALLPEEYEGQNYTEARKLYEQGYSLNQLREKARLKRHYDTYGDAWQQLLITFTGFAQGQPLLAQPALGGLFAKEQCVDIEACELQNHHLFSAFFNLCYFEHNRVLARINYRDMDTEEFGSVYESLLELVPQLSTKGIWQFSFMGDAEDEKSASGHSRKLTGSYYTPDSLVQELIKSALEPVIVDRLKENPKQPRAAILSITVCDPACGSGHFLLAAARRLATELAKIDAGSDQPTEDLYRHAMRDVVRHCIYGVDLNPMAVELCKTGLWLESIEPGKPLGFLDAQIQNGNSILGLTDDSLVKKGIPNGAFKTLEFDEVEVCKHFKKINSEYQEIDHFQHSLFDMHDESVKFDDSYVSLPEDTVEQITEKRAQWLLAIEGNDIVSEDISEKIYCCAFFNLKNGAQTKGVITNQLLAKFRKGLDLSEIEKKLINDISYRKKIFNWTAKYPNIFRKKLPGFDVVLGNPPWDKLQPEEEHFFNSIDPTISILKGKERKDAIQSLMSSAPRLYKKWLEYKREKEEDALFAKESNQYPLTGQGNLNLYRLFSERATQIVSSKGYVGFLVQTGIATDLAGAEFISFQVSNKRIVSFYDFENSNGYFPSVDSRFRFCLMTLTGFPTTASPIYAWLLRSVLDLKNRDRLISITEDDIKSQNPNSKTIPIFVTSEESRISKRIYSRSKHLQDKELSPYKGLGYLGELYNMTKGFRVIWRPFRW